MTRQARGGLATASGLVTIVGIASGNPYWVLFGVVALIVVGLTEMWWRWGGVGLEYRRLLTSTSATCGDIVECTIEVTNRKLLPMPWVDVTDDWPSALVPERVRSRGRGWYRRWGSAAESPQEGSGLTPAAIGEAGLPPPAPLPYEGRGGEGGGGTVARLADEVAQQTDREPVSQRLTLAPFERVRRHYRLPCRRRGAYDFGPVVIRWRDAFGLTSRDADLTGREAFVVYPRTVPVVAPPAASRQLLGDRVRPRALLTDPTRLAGVRPFVTGDSIRRVHWGATARTGVVQVRRDDPTAGRRLWIVVDVETAPEDQWWSAGDTDMHETLAIVAASIASWAIRSGTSVGISANGRTSGSAHDLSVPCAGNPRHIVRILDGLARLRPWPSRPLRDAVTATAHSWPADATIALITAMPSATKTLAIARGARHSQPVLTIDCSDGRLQPPAPLSGDDMVGRRYGATWRLADADQSWASRTEVRLG